MKVEGHALLPSETGQTSGDVPKLIILLKTEQRTLRDISLSFCPLELGNDLSQSP